MTDEEKKKLEQPKEPEKEPEKKSEEPKEPEKKTEEPKEPEKQQEEPKEPEKKTEEPKETEAPKSPSEKAFEAGYTGIVEYAKLSDDPAAVLENLKQMTAAFNTLRQNNINLIDTIGKKYQEESDEKLDHKYEQQKPISIKDIPFKIQRSE